MNLRGGKLLTINTISYMIVLLNSWLLQQNIIMARKRGSLFLLLHEKVGVFVKNVRAFSCYGEVL